ncbi:Beauvericin cluster-specific repressor BEA4 [Fusarium oxysporum f. sp. albedinis]|nr:Beauvericin cluster-specific repressor BEA4 [Fusarium oxysporum f. sp. albedinis]
MNSCLPTRGMALSVKKTRQMLFPGEALASLIYPPYSHKNYQPTSSVMVLSPHIMAETPSPMTDTRNWEASM